MRASARGTFATALRTAVLAAAVLSTSAAVCGTGERRDGASPSEFPTPDARSVESLVAASREEYDAVDTARLLFSLDVRGIDLRIEGESAVWPDGVLYARMAFEGDDVPEDEAKAAIFLPPALYVQDGDGTWFVLSPWNQGIRPDDPFQWALVAPVVDYAAIVQALYDTSREPDETVNGRDLLHISGSMAARDLRLFTAEEDAGDASDEEAGVDLWLDAGTLLPETLAIRAGDKFGFRLTIEFRDLGESLVMPDPPADARPFRDVGNLDAPCTGDDFAPCLEEQTGIEGAPTCDGPGRRICLQPLGRIAPELIDHLVAHYRERYGLEIVVLDPAAMPEGIDDPLREQADAPSLSRYMEALHFEARHDPEAVLIGLTEVDLYDATSHYRYVFGIKGDASDPKAVVSTFRMNPLAYAEPVDEDLLYSRTRKLLTKYIGLLYYGLPPSDDPLSPMYDSILGPADLDRMGDTLPVPDAR